MIISLDPERGFRFNLPRFNAVSPRWKKVKNLRRWRQAPCCPTRSSVLCTAWVKQRLWFAKNDYFVARPTIYPKVKCSTAKGCPCSLRNPASFEL